MTRQTVSPRTSSPAPLTAASPAQAEQRRTVVEAIGRRDDRARAFGIGYGRSSGYVHRQGYAVSWSEGRFRFH